MKPQIPWLRVFVEGAVIVGSILLAFGIDAWWEERQERTEEQQVLRLIHADLVADTIELRRAFGPSETQATAANWLVDHWDDVDIHMDSVRWAIGEFTYWGTYEFRSAAFSSLTEGDRLRLVGDESLRLVIVEYFERLHSALTMRLDRTFSEREALLDLLWPHIRLQIVPGPDGRLSPSVRLVSTWEEVRADSRIPNQLAWLNATWVSALRYRDNSITTNTELRALIETELGL